MGLIVGVVLLVILVVSGIVLVAIVKALFDQPVTGIGQSLGNIITSFWNYAADFMNALWKQVITNPLQFITGGNN